MGMKMPEVMKCSVDQCAYNASNACHAMAITVGEPDGEPACDTFFEADKHGGVQDATAGVGACKQSECTYNKDYECSAANITVGMKGGKADCLTFTMN